MARKPVGVVKSGLTENKTEKKETFDYGLKKIPIKAKDDFEKLKKEGMITGSLNAYIIGSFLKKLREDAL